VPPSTIVVDKRDDVAAALRQLEPSRTHIVSIPLFPKFEHGTQIFPNKQAASKHCGQYNKSAHYLT
jgi:hypothetical protein